MEDLNDKDTILVASVQPSSTRGDIHISKLNVDLLGENIQLFLSQINDILEKTPKKVAKFHFVEFEVSAEITAKGQVILMGTGGEAGVTGSVKFVFRKTAIE